MENQSGRCGTGYAASAHTKKIRMRALVSASALAALLVIMSAAAGQSSGDRTDSPVMGPTVDISDWSAAVVIETLGEGSVVEILSLAETWGIDVTHSDEASGIVTLDSAAADDYFVGLLASLPGVASVSSEKRVRASMVPDDSYVDTQWALDTINAYEAWDITRGDHDVVVAVLDTGIDWAHPDIAANIWNDTNGYHGYNFIADNNLPMDDNINAYDDSGTWLPNQYTYHGTHVAGVVGAVINNAIGVAGMAQVRLMAVKVMNDSGEGTDATVASGIYYAVDHNAQIITMSLGVDGASTALRNAVDYASRQGCVMVAAAGNSGSSFVSYPAAYPQVIAVGATDSTDGLASFSNYGLNLDIMAPGVSIYSTRGGGASYQYLSGTSTAAPYVAGTAALMLSINPALTPIDIGDFLNSTARDISRTGYDTMTGWGIVDAFEAVESVANPTVTITDYPEYAPLNSTISISWMVSGGDPGTIQSTYLRWGLSATSLTDMSESFSGTTWQVFTFDGVSSPDENGTLYIRGYAVVDGMTYESDLLALPVHEPVADNIFLQFLKDVQDFIFNDLGIYNFLLLLGAIVAIPAIAIALRPKRRRTVVRTVEATPLMYSQPPPAQPYVPPPPPPPRFEAYIDLVGQDIMPPAIKVVEGTKVVWVNRSWAPPPGISIRSGRFDEAGEHPDGVFQSGMLIAPGDYWSATFHRPGEYEYYLTGIWKRAKIIVEPFSPGKQFVATAA